MIKRLLAEAFSTKNRINRARFVRNTLIGIGLIPIYIGFLLILPRELRGNRILTSIFFLVTFLVLISLFAQSFKRLKDIGASVFWVFAIFLPLGNLIVYIYLASTLGTKGPNKFGPDSLEKLS